MHRFGLIDFGARGGGRPNAITTSEQNCAIGEQSGRVLMTARDHVSCGGEHANRPPRPDPARLGARVGRIVRRHVSDGPEKAVRSAAEPCAEPLESAAGERTTAMGGRDEDDPAHLR